MIEYVHNQITSELQQNTRTDGGKIKKEVALLWQPLWYY